MSRRICLNLMIRIVGPQKLFYKINYLKGYPILWELFGQFKNILVSKSNQSTLYLHQFNGDFSNLVKFSHNLIPKQSFLFFT